MEEGAAGAAALESAIGRLQRWTSWQRLALVQGAVTLASVAVVAYELFHSQIPASLPDVPMVLWAGPAAPLFLIALFATLPGGNASGHSDVYYGAQLALMALLPPLVMWIALTLLSLAVHSVAARALGVSRERDGALAIGGLSNARKPAAMLLAVLLPGIVLFGASRLILEAGARHGWELMPVPS